MWFPNKIQWIVIWIGAFFFFGLLSANDGEMAVFMLVATIFIVWMLEGRRRRKDHDKDKGIK